MTSGAVEMGWDDPAASHVRVCTVYTFVWKTPDVMGWRSPIHVWHHALGPILAVAGTVAEYLLLGNFTH